MFIRNLTVLAACGCVMCVASSVYAQEDAVDMYERVQGAVVLLDSLDSTGMIINEEGLILTNAHVMASPMRFRCIVDVNTGDEYEAVTFQELRVVGFHPALDMALVQIDPAEHDVELTTVDLNSRAARPGQRVYAIGNPSGGGGSQLNKTITQGILGGVDREIDGDKYYQVDAAINPGNSGGHNPGEAALYYNVGMLLRTLKEYEIAMAYLAESIRIDPWYDGDFIAYRELGLSLAEQERVDEAMIAWKEGVAKYPGTASKIWEDMAVTHGMRSEFYEAAYAAGVVMARERSSSTSLNCRF